MVSDGGWLAHRAKLEPADPKTFHNSLMNVSREYPALRRWASDVRWRFPTTLTCPVQDRSGQGVGPGVRTASEASYTRMALESVGLSM